jgi:hypothetical protein
MAKRKLSDIELEEVSLVGRAANKRKFLVCKAEKLEIGIVTDGTSEGTEVKVNGEELKEITNFYFSYSGDQNMGMGVPYVTCNYAKVVEFQDGFKRTETYWLSKGESMNAELEKALKELIGKADQVFVQKELSEEAIKAIKDALTAVNKYKADFPDDLKSAVEILAEYAASGYGYPEKKSASPQPQPQPAKKDDSVLTNSQPKPVTADEVKGLIEAMAKSQKESLDKLTQSVGEFKVRLDKVESNTAVRKGIEGQDGDDDKGGGDDKDPFPSLKID